MKRHMKRLAMPKTWPFPRKEGGRFITRPLPRAPFLLGLPLKEILKYNLQIAYNSKEAEILIRNKEVLVNGKPRKNGKFLVSLFDVVSLPKLNKHYRLVFGENKKLTLIEIPEEEANLKIIPIIRKQKVKKGKIQLTGLDSTNIQLEDSNLKPNDSILYDLKERKIVKELPLKENSYAYIYRGKNIGFVGKIIKVDYDEHIHKKIVTIEDENNNKITTFANNIMIIGEEKPEIKIK